MPWYKRKAVWSAVAALLAALGFGISPEVRAAIWTLIEALL